MNIQMILRKAHTSEAPPSGTFCSKPSSNEEKTAAINGKTATPTSKPFMTIFAGQKKTLSIKVDTNFDNIPMMKILDKLRYTYCGEIFFQWRFAKGV